jgi:hypothetical protein
LNAEVKMQLSIAVGSVVTVTSGNLAGAETFAWFLEKNFGPICDPNAGPPEEGADTYAQNEAMFNLVAQALLSVMDNGRQEA